MCRSIGHRGLELFSHRLYYFPMENFNLQNSACWRIFHLKDINGKAHRFLEVKNSDFFSGREANQLYLHSSWCKILKILHICQLDLNFHTIFSSIAYFLRLLVRKSFCFLSFLKSLSLLLNCLLILEFNKWVSAFNFWRA